MSDSDASQIDTTAARTAERLHAAAIHLLRRLRREDVASGLTAPRLSALSVVVFGGPLSRVVRRHLTQRAEQIVRFSRINFWRRDPQTYPAPSVR